MGTHATAPSRRSWWRPALLAAAAAALGLILASSACLAGVPWDPDGVLVSDSGYGQYSHIVVTDGAGGAVVVWVEFRSSRQELYVQRIDAAGNRRWGPTGVLVASAPYFYGYDMVTGGPGGAIVTWSQYAPGETRFVTYLQKFDENGSPLWQAGGVPCCNEPNGAKIMPSTVSDGAAGAVVSWTDTRPPAGDYNIYAQRIASAGTYLWDPAGVALCVDPSEQTNAFMAPGGDGGAVVGWEDRRSGDPFNLYSQKVNAAGATAWAPDGVVLCDSTGTKEGASLVTDGFGGAIAAWADSRGDFWNVYSQRIVAAGSTNWAANGVRVCSATGNQEWPVMTDDAAGGAIMAWDDTRSPSNRQVYAQHLNGAGSLVQGWSPTGNPVSSNSDLGATGADITTNGSGGALVTFISGGQILGASVMDVHGPADGSAAVQNLLSDGSVAPGWSKAGESVTVTPSDQEEPLIAPDGAGGGIVVWRDYRTNEKNLYAKNVGNPISTWYLAEGSTAWGYQTYLTIENPNARAVTARVTMMTPGGPVAPQDIPLAPSSQTTVNPEAILGYSTDFSTKVECPQQLPIAVDRTMSWTGLGTTSPEAHSSVGVTSPARTWYMPEGSSAWGFETWLLIQNPNAAEATCAVTYMMASGVPKTVDKTVPANSRRSFNMADDIGAQDSSIMVESDLAVVPERSMYRNNRREGHESIGTTTTSQDYYLAEGTTAWGFTTYVLIQNPGSDPATVTLTFNTPQGRVTMDSFSMPSYSRKTIKLNDVLPPTDVSAQVHSDQQIIAERAMYWGAGTPAGEATHDSIGMPEPHGTFYLPDGQTSDGRETFVLIQNPNETDVAVRVTYLGAGGAGNVTFDESIPAFGRKTLNMVEKVPGGKASVLVECTSAGKSIMVERAMYWNGRSAGTDTIGAFTD